MSLKESLTPAKIKESFEKTVQDVKFKTGNLVLVTEQHYVKARTFFEEEFARDEPTAVALNMTMNATMEGLYTHMITQNMSFMLVHPGSGDVMGLRVMGVTNLDDRLPIDEAVDDSTKSLLTFWQQCDDRADFYTRYGAKEYITFIGLGVARKYRRQRIATHLMEATLAYIKNFGVSPIYIKGGSASKYSAIIYDKLGYDLLYEIRYDKYVVDGKQVFCNTGEHEIFKVYGKKL